jgi:hypothetical protein
MVLADEAGTQELPSASGQLPLAQVVSLRLGWIEIDSLSIIPDGIYEDLCKRILNTQAGFSCLG